MDKCKQFKKRTWKLLFKNLIIFGVLVAVTVLGVLSWFTINKTVTADGMQITSCSPAGLDIAIVDPSLTGTALTDYLKDDNNWHTGNTTFTSTDYPFLSELNLRPITGNGISLIKPPQMQSSAVAHVQTGDAWDSAAIQTVPNTDYLSFDIYMRSTGINKKVVLKGDTYFGPLDVSAAMSNANGISSNTVIGAARMAILNDTFNARKLLWVPAPHLYYNGTTLNENVTNISNNFGLFYVDSSNNNVSLNNDGTYNHGYYNSDQTRGIINYANYNNSGFNPSTSVTATPKVNNQAYDYKLHKITDLATLDSRLTYYTSENNSSANYVYFAKRARVNVWIEGEDPESRANQVGGQFKIDLRLKLADNN
jgi:hypothetical protein